MTRNVIGRTVVEAAAVALLSGCGGGSAAISPPQSIDLLRMSPVTIRGDAQHYGNDWMYATQPFGNDLSIYRRKGLSLKWHENLTTGVSAPQGTITTVNGWWYVANGGDSNVLIYRTTKKGPAGPIGTLDDAGQFPVNVYVTPDRRLVAVSNFGSGSRPGSVNIYLNRRSKPSRTLTFGVDNVAGMGVAIDHQGNCYWSFNDPSAHSGSIVEFHDCKGSGSVIVPGISVAGGVAFDQSDDLLYVDEVHGIYKCKKTSACEPFSKRFGIPTNINFDYKDKYLWVADASGYIDAVDSQGVIRYHHEVVGGASNPPIGIAPSPGGD